MHELFFILALAVLIDRLFGEPPERFHTTVWMGRGISMLSPAGKQASGRLKNSILNGALLFVFVAFTSSGIALFSMLLFRGPVLTIILGGVLLKMQFSWKGLSDHAMPIVSILEQDLEKGRTLLSRIVGRDTHSLNREEILSGVVESIGESTTDSITAPLFYYFLLGLAFGPEAGVSAAIFFRAVNTLDSMVGYKKEGLDRVGLISAKADDILNFLPARITALLMILSAFILHENSKNAVRIFKRDRKNTKSPNSGQTMAVMAGALGVRLEKIGYYRIGEPLKKIHSSDVERAIRISNLATVLFLFMGTILIL